MEVKISWDNQRAEHSVKNTAPLDALDAATADYKYSLEIYQQTTKTRESKSLYV